MNNYMSDLSSAEQKKMFLSILLKRKPRKKDKITNLVNEIWDNKQFIFETSHFDWLYGSIAGVLGGAVGASERCSTNVLILDVAIVLTAAYFSGKYGGTTKTNNLTKSKQTAKHSK